MGERANQLREYIRTSLTCRCPIRAQNAGRAVPPGTSFHYDDCQWTTAVHELYALERADEAPNNHSNEEHP